MTPTPATSSDGRFQSPEVRRRQILDAAAELAINEGLENTSVARVAEAAGIAKGSIYLHFASRQDLLAGLQADLWQRMLATPNDIISDDTLSWSARIGAVVEHWMRFEFEHHGLYHAVFHTIATDSNEPLEAARSLLAELIDRGTDAGEFHTGALDADVIVEFLLNGYVGPCFHHTNADTAIDTVRQLFNRVLGITKP